MQDGVEGPRTNLAIVVDGKFAGAVGLELGQDVHRYSAELGYCT